MILPDRMAGESLTKEKEDDENSHVSNQLEALAKKLTYFADRNATGPLTNEEMSQLAYGASLSDLSTLEKYWTQQMTNGGQYTSE